MGAVVIYYALEMQWLSGLKNNISQIKFPSVIRNITYYPHLSMTLHTHKLYLMSAYSLGSRTSIAQNAGSVVRYIPRSSRMR